MTVISTFNIFESNLEDFKKYMVQEKSLDKLKSIEKLLKNTDQEKHKHVLNLIDNLKEND